MFRMWGKVFRENRMVKDITICDAAMEKNRTRKVFDALEEICYTFDIEQPTWLDSNIHDFQRYDKTRFYQDNFIETIDFDYLEIHVIEE